MRARNIKPGFFTNEDLAELPPAGRLLFIGLWMLADREGRLEDRPRRIKMAVFPADALDVEPLLEQLQGVDLIVRYEVEGNAYIWIPSFTKHQRPHPREVASTIPEYPGNTQATPNGLSEAPEGNAQAQPGNGPGDTKVLADPSDIQDPLNPGSSDIRDLQDPLNPGSSESSPPGSSSADRAKRAQPTRYPDEFEQLWMLYPKRAGSNPKRRACQAFNARLKSGRTASEMLDGTRRYARFCDLTGKTGTEFVMQAATFLGPDEHFDVSWRPGANGKGQSDVISRSNEAIDRWLSRPSNAKTIEGKPVGPNDERS